ncbi:MAG: hypothetical protein AAF430_01365 [Myxococcota bacterium]
MTTKNNTQANTQAQQSPNAPDFIAYSVIDRGVGNKPFWRSIGSAWMHEDGNGLQVRLDAMPLEGTVTLRIPLPTEEDTRS